MCVAGGTKGRLLHGTTATTAAAHVRAPPDRRSLDPTEHPTSSHMHIYGG